MNEQVGPRAMLDDLRENLPLLRETLRELPVILKNLATLLAKSDGGK
jgi:hypothetical protein